MRQNHRYQKDRQHRRHRDIHIVPTGRVSSLPVGMASQAITDVADTFLRMPPRHLAAIMTQRA